MASRYHHCVKKGLLQTPPDFIKTNLHYEVLMGSVAYAVSNDMSDMDIYGWAIPPKELVFPHLAGQIDGFGTQKQRFDVWQQHHVRDPSAGRTYDFAIYNVVRYLHLCMENNPNMLDSLFVPARCVLHMTPIANLVRERRKEFLHKGAYHKLKGYAFAQLSKMDVKKQSVPEVHAVWALEDEYGIDHGISYEEVQRHPIASSLEGLTWEQREKYVGAYKALMEKNKRLEGLKRFGYDVKFAYHVIRLASQCEQILTEGDLELDEKGRREHMKAVRAGSFTQQDIHEWFTEKERSLGALFERSKLPDYPDENKIKRLLLDVLESHYGSLKQAEIVIPTREKDLLTEIAKLVKDYR